MIFKEKKNLVGFLSAISLMGIAVLIAAIFAKNATVQKSFSASYSCFACGGSQSVTYRCALSNPSTSSCTSTALSNCSSDSNCSGGTLSCSAGQYYNSSTDSCMSCPGSYTSNAGSTGVGSCYVYCAAGTRIANYNDGSCSVCGKGYYKSATTHYYNTAAESCSKCPDGYTTASTTASSASECIASTAPTSCPAGQGLSGGECQSCAAGQYSPAGSTSCLPCSGNKQYSASGAASCSTCDNGQIANSGHTGCINESTAVQCSPGKYIKAGASTCTTTCTAGSYCPGGNYTPSTEYDRGIFSCPNTYTTGGSGAMGIQECKATCPASYYHPAGGDRGCVKCPEGTYTSSSVQVAYQGASTCSTCPSDEKVNSTQTGCVSIHAVITCIDPVYNRSEQTIARCNGGTISNATQTAVGSYTVTCAGDADHLDADPKTCYIRSSGGGGGTSTSYTITYDVNGGKAWTSTTCASPYTFTSSGSKCTKNILSGDTYGGFPTPTRTGYTFKEWNTKSDGTGTKITTSSIVNSSRTIYAIWEENDLNVTVKPKISTIGINDTVALTAIVKPDNVPNKSVTWSSSDSTIATVNENGVVTGKKTGTVTITVTTVEKNKSDTATVIVKQVACPAGQYMKQNGTSLADCEPCPAGTYSNSGATACTPCVENTYTSTSGQSSCSVCDSNQIANKTHTACQERPEEVIVCSPGTYLKANGTTQADCETCPIGYYCPGGEFIPDDEDQGEFLCPANHINGDRGTIWPEYCKIECSTGTYKGEIYAGACVNCPEGKTSSAHIVNYDQVSPDGTCYDKTKIIDPSNPKTGLFEVGGALIGVLGLSSIAYIILKKRKIINI